MVWSKGSTSLKYIIQSKTRKNLKHMSFKKLKTSIEKKKKNKFFNVQNSGMCIKNLDSLTEYSVKEGTTLSSSRWRLDISFGSGFLFVIVLDHFIHSNNGIVVSHLAHL